MSKFALLLLVVLAGPLAKAADSDAAINCKNAESTYEMKACAGQSADSADQQLNKVYNKLAASLKQAAVSEKKQDPQGQPESAEILNRLVKSEKAWIAFRDANCSLQSTEMLNGSGEGLVYLSCVSKMTSDRLQELKDFSSTDPK